MSFLRSIKDLPRKVPFFYGWCIAGASVIGVISSIPGQTMGVSVFTPKLMEALGLTSQQLSTAYGIGTITSGFLLVRAGRLVDRFGVRPTMVAASIALGLILILMAQTGNIAAAIVDLFNGAFAIAISMIVATLSFFMLRFVGQGLMAMIPRVMVGKWWDRRRGFVSGLTGIFTAFAFGIAPVFLAKLIEIFNWQGAYYVMAGTIGIGVAAICWLLYREQPQDYGLLPDGHEPAEKSDHEPEREIRHFTLAEARRNYSFWIFSFGLGGHGMVITAVTFHIIALAKSSGMTEQQGIAIFLPIALLNVLANFTGGWVSDRTKLKHILIFMMIMQAIGTIALINFGDPLWRTFVIIGFGLSGGLWGTLVNVTWPRYFGTLHLGAISGQNVSIMVIATSIGPLSLAASMEKFGSYTPGLITCAIIPILVLIAAFRVQNPQPNPPF